MKAQNKKVNTKRIFKKKTSKKEEVKTPFMLIVDTFKDNKIALFSFFAMLIIFLTVIIGPIFNPIDLSFTEVSQKHIAPGFNFLKIPSSLQGHLKTMAVGPTYTIAVSDEGGIYVWGYTKLSPTQDLRNIPNEIIDKADMIEELSCNTDHVLVRFSDGSISGWGNTRLKQLRIPKNIENGTIKVKSVFAGEQYSLVLTDENKAEGFGRIGFDNFDKFNEYQGSLAKAFWANDAAFGIDNDGKLVFLGTKTTADSKLPVLDAKAVDVKSTVYSNLVLDENGKIHVWGIDLNNQNVGQLPEIDGKVAEIAAGRFHYIARTEDNKLYAWGTNRYNAIDIPSKYQGLDIKNIYAGGYTNYIVTNDNKIYGWGLKGYLLGTDDFGRDIWNRILNGGKKSMTIGAVSVIISTIIGILVGGFSGYFGGWVDMLLQRLSEMVGSLPFLPFAMILSSLVGNKISAEARIWMIMVVLGLLSWTGIQRLVRAQILSIREQEYVLSAKTIGIKESRIVFRHILPNVISIIIVNATLGFAGSMLTESSLSFLGFGVPAPYPTWGNMLYGANNSVVIQWYWWRWVFASVILAICVICINLIGDGLREAIDPKSQGR